MSLLKPIVGRLLGEISSRCGRAQQLVCDELERIIGIASLGRVHRVHRMHRLHTQLKHLGHAGHGQRRWAL